MVRRESKYAPNSRKKEKKKIKKKKIHNTKELEIYRLLR